MPEHMNICLVAKKFSYSARAADHGYLFPIARELVKKGHSVTVVSWENPLKDALIEKDGVVMHFLAEGQRRPQKFNVESVSKIKELHKQQPFDLIHCFDSSGIEVGKLKKQLKVAVAYDGDATQMSQIFSIMGMATESLRSLMFTGLAVLYKFVSTYYRTDRKILKMADGVFVTSPQQGIMLERYYLYPELKTFIIPYGIEISEHLNTEAIEELRKNLKLSENSHVAVAFSDMTEFEEIKNILHAFSKVAVKKPNSRLIIVGNGPLKRDFEYEMYNLALGSKVIFAGAIKNTQIPHYIGLADIFVNLSSRTTGFEPNMLEAMAQQKVVIGSEVSPIANLIEDSVDGFLIRPADRSTLAKLMIMIFSGQITTSDLGERAKNKVTNLFDLNNLVEQTVDAYYKVLELTGRYKSRAQTNI